jgi:hypothetical protein
VLDALVDWVLVGVWDALFELGGVMDADVEDGDDATADEDDDAGADGDNVPKRSETVVGLSSPHKRRTKTSGKRNATHLASPIPVKRAIIPQEKTWACP